MPQGVVKKEQGAAMMIRGFRQPELRRPTGDGSGKRRGAALVEMAMVLPVFVTIILGVIEFGRAMMVGQLVTNAAREGARLATLNGTTNQMVQSEVTSSLAATVGTSTGNISVTISNANPSSGNTLTNAVTDDLITVNVSIPFTSISYLTPAYLGGKNLTGICSMRHE